MVSFSIKAMVLLVPLAVGVVAVKAAIVLVPRPDGVVLFWTWMMALIAVSFGASICAQRVLRRLAPLAMLFKMSLVFPDEAPSRFSAAMRSGSIRSLIRHSQRAETSSAAQKGAEELVALVARLSRHDRITRGHAERVRAYSVMLGEQLGLGRDDLDKLNWAALVHDIGKLQVPESLLNKPGKPTADEWRVLRVHPAVAGGYIEPLRAWLGDWVDAASQHHERFDGKGYPRGLSGKDISLSGRIVSIADAYDVMTAARSYKKPLPAPQARAELTRNSGTQFDPHLVRSFLEISLGKMRHVLGPLGWLSQLPGIIRTPVTAVTMSATGFTAAGAIGLATAVGAVAPPPVDSGRHLATAAPHVQQVNTSDDPNVVVVGETPGDPAQTAPPSSTAPPTSAAVDDQAVLVAGAPTSDPAPAPTTSTPPPEAVIVPEVVPADTAPAPTTAEETTTTSATTVASTTVATTTPVAGTMNAVDDRAGVDHNKTVSIHVLQNDDFGGSDPNLSSLAVVVAPSHGSLTVSGENLVYKPHHDYRGTDSMSYSICSQSGSCDQATVVVTVRH